MDLKTTDGMTYTRSPMKVGKPFGVIAAKPSIPERQILTFVTPGSSESFLTSSPGSLPCPVVSTTIRKPTLSESPDGNQLVSPSTEMPELSSASSTLPRFRTGLISSIETVTNLLPW
ncbi:MAG: hypothetical protein QXP81_00155 [Nitrososphaerota archaeon]